MIKKIANKLIDIAARRNPSFVIGKKDDPYLYGWDLIPKNLLFNIRLHKFLRSDNDVLHDHPWINVSIMLRGSYIEHTIRDGGVHVRNVFREGNFKIRWSGKKAHRIEVEKPCWTLFLTGPKYRTWGFHCSKGWVSFQDFFDKN